VNVSGAFVKITNNGDKLSPSTFAAIYGLKRKT